MAVTNDCAPCYIRCDTGVLSDTDCLAFLESVRWSGQPVCPYCDSERTSEMPKERRHRCNNCKTAFSATVGTIFHRSHLPLRKWFADELAKWAKMFPDEFYEQMARLRGLHYSEIATRRPGYIGRLTNDIVYERLAPGVLDELRRKTPKDEKGRRKYKYHQ